MSGGPTVGLLLAAGAGTRFGGGKLLAPLHGRPLVLHALAALQAALEQVLAVVRPGDAALAAVLAQAGARVLECPHAHLGMGHSLACGAQQVPAGAALVVALGDMPAIASETVCRIRQALAGGAVIAVPTYHGRRGHPVGFSAAAQVHLRSLHGDQGARALLQRQAAQVQEVPVEDPGILRDVDTPEQLSALAGQPLAGAAPPAE